nr:MAG TPA: hypothetical protein [Caudoviricetes sp.]
MFISDFLLSLWLINRTYSLVYSNLSSHFKAGFPVVRFFPAVSSNSEYVPGFEDFFVV